MPFKFFAFVSVMGLCGMLAASCAKSSDSANAGGASATPAESSAPASPEVSAGAQGQAVATAGDVTKGEAVFGANCAACHGAKGAGGGIGPALVGEKNRKSTAAAIAWIENPQPPMPKLYPSPLSEKDVADVAAYVESL